MAISFCVNFKNGAPSCEKTKICKWDKLQSSPCCGSGVYAPDSRPREFRALFGRGTRSSRRHHEKKKGLISLIAIPSKPPALRWRIENAVKYNQPGKLKGQGTRWLPFFATTLGITPVSPTLGKFRSLHNRRYFSFHGTYWCVRLHMYHHA